MAKELAPKSLLALARRRTPEPDLMTPAEASPVTSWSNTTFELMARLSALLPPRVIVEAVASEASVKVRSAPLRARPTPRLRLLCRVWAPPLTEMVPPFDDVVKTPVPRGPEIRAEPVTVELPLMASAPPLRESPPENVLPALDRTRLFAGSPTLTSAPAPVMTPA